MKICTPIVRKVHLGYVVAVADVETRLSG